MGLPTSPSSVPTSLLKPTFSWGSEPSPDSCSCGKWCGLSFLVKKCDRYSDIFFVRVTHFVHRCKAMANSWPCWWPVAGSTSSSPCSSGLTSWTASGLMSDHWAAWDLQGWGSAVPLGPKQSTLPSQGPAGGTCLGGSQPWHLLPQAQALKAALRPWKAGPVSGLSGLPSWYWAVSFCTVGEGEARVSSPARL